MKRETLFLKFAVVLMGLPVLALSIFLLPELSRYVAEISPAFPYTKYLFLIGMYTTAIMFFLALYQTIKLLTYIEKNKVFTELSISALKNIKYYAIIIGILYIAELPIIYLIADVDDAPGMILIGLFIIFLCSVVAVFDTVLQRIFKNGMDINKGL